MNKSEAIAFIEKSEWKEKKKDLRRMKDLMSRLGDPQDKLRFVHVTGTNGKGSTATMIATVLETAGYKTGLLTSPHLIEYNERIRINRRDIPDEDFCRYAERVKEVSGLMADPPGFSEKLVAMAFMYFAESGCDIAVLEVGVGGRLDATNIIRAPEVAVIANIGLDHTSYLGDTVEKIAFQKAGIIKSGCHAAIYDSTPGAVQVIRDVCFERGVPMSLADFSLIEPEGESLDGQVFSYKSLKHIKLPLLGKHQMRNCANVIEAVRCLQARGWNISDEQLRKGIENTAWAARFEVLRKDPPFVLDGGHNPQCIEALAENVAVYFKGQKVTFLVGVMADKDYNTELRSVLPYAKRFVCVSPGGHRGLESEKLAAFAETLGVEAVFADSVTEGVHLADSFADSPVVCFGSLYISGEIRTALGLK